MEGSPLKVSKVFTSFTDKRKKGTHMEHMVSTCAQILWIKQSEKEVESLWLSGGVRVVKIVLFRLYGGRRFSSHSGL